MGEGGGWGGGGGGGERGIREDVVGGGAGDRGEGGGIGAVLEERTGRLFSGPCLSLFHCLCCLSSVSTVCAPLHEGPWPLCE